LEVSPEITSICDARYHVHGYGELTLLLQKKSSKKSHYLNGGLVNGTKQYILRPPCLVVENAMELEQYIQSKTIKFGSDCEAI
jgi:hypothetical protein